MANLFEVNNLFIFSWKFTNLGMCALNRDEVLESPLFVLDGLDKTTWSLRLYFRGEDNESISLYLKRCGDAPNPEKISIDFSFDFNVGNGVISKQSIDDFSGTVFKVGDDYGYEDLFLRSSVLSDTCDVLTVQLYMWRSERNDIGNISEKELSVVSESSIKEVSESSIKEVPDSDVLKERLCASIDDLIAKCHFASFECCVHTLINVQRMSVTIPLENLCKDKLNNKLHFPVVSSMKNSPSFMLAIQISDANTIMSIEIRRIVESSCQHFVFCKITAFNEEKSSVLFKSDKHLFCAEATEDIWYFPDFIHTLTSSKLNLYCEFDISTKGDEHHVYDTNVDFKFQSDNLSVENFNVLARMHQNISQCQKSTDCILTCGNKILWVHKNLLTASSSVFRSLFKKTSRVIHIDDLEIYVLNRILLFLYTKRLEDIDTYDIRELYPAAHKYKVLSLMQYCIEQLKIIMSPHNVYEILILADTYSIVDVFSAAENFIQSNAKEVFKSSAWLDFSNKMPILAGKISQSILKKVLNI